MVEIVEFLIRLWNSGNIEIVWTQRLNNSSGRNVSCWKFLCSWSWKPEHWTSFSYTTEATSCKNKLKRSWPKKKKRATLLFCGCFRVQEDGGSACLSWCLWLTFVAVAFTCTLLFEHSQVHSGWTMSQYQAEPFYVCVSFGPWLDPDRVPVCLNLSGVKGHAGRGASRA